MFQFLWPIGVNNFFSFFFVSGGGDLIAKLCRNLATPWTVAWQAPLSMGFSRQEYWRGLPFPSPGDFPELRIKTWSPALQARSEERRVGKEC